MYHAQAGNTLRDDDCMVHRAKWAWWNSGTLWLACNLWDYLEQHMKQQESTFRVLGNILEGKMLYALSYGFKCYCVCVTEGESERDLTWGAVSCGRVEAGHINDEKSMRARAVLIQVGTCGCPVHVTQRKNLQCQRSKIKPAKLSCRVILLHKHENIWAKHSLHRRS